MAVGGTRVAVGGTGVGLGGTGVAVGGAGVIVGGTEVAVGGTGEGLSVKVGLEDETVMDTVPPGVSRVATRAVGVVVPAPAPSCGRKKNHHAPPPRSATHNTATTPIIAQRAPDEVAGAAGCTTGHPPGYWG